MKIHYNFTLVIVCLLFVTSIVGASVEQTDFYVSVNGDDFNPGTKDKPFATLTKSRDAIREIISKGLTSDLTVLIRGGTYTLEKSLVFDARDSGSDKYSITYAGYSDEKVIITGGLNITEWEKGQSGIWTAYIPDVEQGKWYFRQLFANDKRLIRARFPNEGEMLTVAELDKKMVGL